MKSLMARWTSGAFLIPMAMTAAVLAQPAPKPGKPIPTTAELQASLKVPAGWKGTIFAQPPDVAYPTCVATSPTGEVYIGIDEAGSLGKQPDAGRVMRCVDTRGDGRADKITVFAKMDHPRGIIWDKDRLYVLHPPFLTVYYDDNHTGVSNRSEDLLTGISTEESVKSRGADHTTNGICMGIDGWIYIAVGDFGFFHCVQHDGKVMQQHGGGVARVRPDGTELEMVSINQRNIYGVAIDPLMNIFTRDNTNDGDGWDERFHYVVPLANLGYPMLFKNFTEDLLPRIADYGGGAPCGSVFIDEPGLPDGFGYSLYCCDWGKSRVYHHPLAPDGANFKVKQEDFITIPSPTEMEIDGQGQMYITSWRGGSFQYGGAGIGFVARVSTGEKRPPVPDLGKATDVQLVGFVASNSGFLRLHAQRELLRRGAKPGVADGLEAIAKSSKPMPARVAAMFTLKQLLGDKSTPIISKMIGDDGLREFVLRILADRKPQAAGVPSEAFTKALNDANPRVRLQAINGLVRLVKTDAETAILARTDDKDPVVAHVAMRGLIVMHADDACIAALDHAESPTYTGAVNVLKWFHEPKVVNALIAELGKQKDPAARKPLMTALCRLYFEEAAWDGKWWSTRPNSVGPYYKGVTWSESAKIGKVLTDAMASADPETAKFLLGEFTRHHLDIGDPTKQIVATALKTPSYKPTAVDLLSGKPLLGADAIKFLESVAISTKEDAALRVKAVRGLRQAVGNDALDAVVRVLASAGSEGGGDPEMKRIREDFVRGGNEAQNVAYFTKLSADTDAAKRELAYSVLVLAAKNKQLDAKLRTAALAAVTKGFARPASAASVLRAIGQTQADGYTTEIASHISDTNAAVKDAAMYAQQQLKSTAPVPGGKTIADMTYEEAVAGALAAKGDPILGAQLFLRQGCVACHTVSPNDPPKGPFLGDIAVRSSRADMIESVLKPSAKIAQGFQTHFFEMNDGTRLEGFIVKEGADDAEMRDITGKSTAIKFTDVKKRGKLDTSIMPEGLVGALSVEEFASLLAYFESIKGKPQ